MTLLFDTDLDDCPVCTGSAERGWTCEDHPDKPWRHSGCRGAGAPCVCNPRGAALWAMVYSDALRAPGMAPPPATPLSSAKRQQARSN